MVSAGANGNYERVGQPMVLPSNWQIAKTGHTEEAKEAIRILVDLLRKFPISQLPGGVLVKGQVLPLLRRCR